VSFIVDTYHITEQTIGSYLLSGIPYAGPVVAEYFWSGELCFFGFDINIPALKPYGKTPEEWVKYWINSLLGYLLG